MTKPLVAIIGRPNVGKSTLFNNICGKKISIVKDEPGVTRDRIYGESKWAGHAFSVVDTGGLDLHEKSDFQQNITRQAQIAIEFATVIVLVVDAKEGLVHADKEAVDFLRGYSVPIVLAVNKLDNYDVEKTYDFYELGIGQPIGVSAEQSKGIGDLLDAVVSHFGATIDEENEKEVLSVAIVGKPNAGKSSVVNTLLGENRVMVSDVAGTTRDAIDTPFRYNGKDYTLIDTAGIRRKRSIDKDSVELISVFWAFEAIRRADVSILVIDANEGISEQDVRLAGFIHEQGKPSVVVMNKWDLIEKDNKTMNKFLDILQEELKFMAYFKPVFVSALTGQRMGQIMESVEEVLKHSRFRIGTSDLNEILQNAVLTNEPPTHSGRRSKIYYITQVAISPPTFVIFVNNKDIIHFSYIRYLENSIRAAVDFSGTPIKIILRNKSDKGD